MLNRGFLTGLMVAATLLAESGSVFGISCDECLKNDKEKRQVAAELDAKSKELTAAMDGKQYDKVKNLDQDITELKKKQFQLRKNEAECKKACTPEVIKKSECQNLKLQIREKESNGAPTKEKIERIDALYRDLRRCNVELRRFKPEAK